MRYVDVFGTRMAYRETGRGDPLVFLHGNPTSSYLWRDVLGHVAPLGRCVAPDLVGMGASAKLPGTGDDRYRFVEHRRYLAGFLAALGVRERVTLVGHDWGGVLAVDWARAHPDAVRGIAYLETLVAPVSWDGPNAPAPALFGPLRTAAGEDMVLRDNVFVETVLPAGTVRTLTDEEMDAYRQPYRRPGEDRRPTLTWPREIPIDGTPEDVHEIVTANAEFMGRTAIPKLFVDGDPGALLTGPLRDLCRTWPHQHEATVPGLHFLPEDSPHPSPPPSPPGSEPSPDGSAGRHGDAHRGRADAARRRRARGGAARHGPRSDHDRGRRRPSLRRWRLADAAVPSPGKADGIPPDPAAVRPEHVVDWVSAHVGAEADTVFRPAPVRTPRARSGQHTGP